MSRPLVSGFCTSAEHFGERPAVQIKDKSISYAQLLADAQSLAATLQKYGGTDEKLTGVFGHRSFTAISGVLAGLLRGGAYVPLNPAFPEDRTLNMIERAELTSLVVETEAFEKLQPILAKIERTLVVVLPDCNEPIPANKDCAHHAFFTKADLRKRDEFRLVSPDSEELAYLLFTSGSTGQPKGVMVKQRNVTHFVDCMIERYAISEHDRFSQTFDLTFDLSAFDMFVAWEKGACVCIPTQGEKMLPAKYVQQQNISIWFSVPSTAIMMKKLRMLKADAYPSIRFSLFCGEALPLEVTEAFQLAAPNSIVENLYGPTELTIACTLYRYDRATSPQESALGVVPIGYAYPGMHEIIVDEKLHEVEAGQAGELLMTGPQLTAGYWKDVEKTNAAFVVPPGRSEIYYRTGDRVRREEHGPLLYLGRVDNQIKVQGYRVELGEIEALIRQAAVTDIAIACGQAEGVNGTDSIIAFMSASTKTKQQIMAELAHQLPGYMQPRDIVTVGEFPLNSNGKIDRKELMERFAKGTFD